MRSLTLIGRLEGTGFDEFAGALLYRVSGIVPGATSYKIDFWDTSGHSIYHDYLSIDSALKFMENLEKRWNTLMEYNAKGL